MENLTYIVVGNNAEHSGFIGEENLNNIWSNENPGGWTNQDVCGSHGVILGEFEKLNEANKCLSEFLKCDSVENNTYCFTHNPIIN